MRAGFEQPRRRAVGTTKRIPAAEYRAIAPKAADDCSNALVGRKRDSEWASLLLDENMRSQPKLSNGAGTEHSPGSGYQGENERHTKRSVSHSFIFLAMTDIGWDILEVKALANERLAGVELPSWF